MSILITNVRGDVTSMIGVVTEVTVQIQSRGKGRGNMSLLKLELGCAKVRSSGFLVSPGSRDPSARWRTTDMRF